MTSEHPHSRTLRRVATVVFAILFVSAGAVSPVAAERTQQTSPAFTVSLQADGDAAVTLRMTFDLSSESERKAFEQLKEQKQNLTENFRNRLSRVANETAKQTGRKMQIKDVSVTFETVNQTGVVELSATWTNLARVDGETVVLAEPFASGFEPDRRFVVVGPEGYQLQSVTPKPASQSKNRAVWASDANLTGFEAAFVPSAEGTSTPTPEATPKPTETKGPTPLPTALLAALAALGAVSLRRR